MRLFVENQIGSPLEIKVHFWDTVLDIKEKIFETQHISVHKQTLFFQGKVLEDDLCLEHCLIKHKSRLQLFISAEHIPDHSNEQEPQTQQSPLPSTDQDSDYSQGSSLTFGRSDNSQVLQTELYPVTSNSNGEDLSFTGITAEQFNNIQSMPATTEEIINQDSLMTVGSNNNSVLQTDQSPPLNFPDSPVKKQNKSSPRKLRVLVLPFRAEQKIAMEVNEKDNVEELRKELVEMQKRSQLNLPQNGYFFKHKQRVLDDDQSFERNGVAHGDTIEILPEQG